MSFKDITGRKKNRLTAISFVKRENGYTFWKYKCDCGKEVIKKSGDVQNSKTKSCGCLVEEHLVRLADHNRSENNQVCKNKLFSKYKRAANARNIIFNITQSEFESFLDKDCFYCGNKPQNEIKEGKFSSLKYNGIDRRVNKIGYELSNCVSCCFTCNKMKMNLDYEAFMKQITKIYKHEGFL